MALTSPTGLAENLLTALCPFSISSPLVHQTICQNITYFVIVYKLTQIVLKKNRAAYCFKSFNPALQTEVEYEIKLAGESAHLCRLWVIEFTHPCEFSGDKAPPSRMTDD